MQNVEWAVHRQPGARSKTRRLEVNNPAPLWSFKAKFIFWKILTFLHLCKKMRCDFNQSIFDHSSWNFAQMEIQCNCLVRFDESLSCII